MARRSCLRILLGSTINPGRLKEEWVGAFCRVLPEFRAEAAGFTLKAYTSRLRYLLTPARTGPALTPCDGPPRPPRSPKMAAWVGDATRRGGRATERSAGRGEGT